MSESRGSIKQYPYDESRRHCNHVKQLTCTDALQPMSQRMSQSFSHSFIHFVDYQRRSLQVFRAACRCAADSRWSSGAAAARKEALPTIDLSTI